jgi:K+-sensing histidine kinase KdpD
VSNLKSRTGATAYLLAVLAVLAMAGLRWLLAPALGQQVPFTTFLIAVIVVAWAGGLGPALCAVVLSTLLGWFLFIPPIYSLQLVNRMELIRILLFALVGVIAAFLGESRLRAQERAESAAADARRAADLARAEAARAEEQGSRAEAAAV